MSEQQILISAIVDPEWNSRIHTGSATEYNEVINLADSMATESQLQPIGVEETEPGAYTLVYGSRRLRAAKHLGWTSINADVRPSSDAATRVIRNVVENVKRKDLTSYEQARACVKLRECGMTAVAVGERLGFSKQKVSNLAVSYTALPPNILLEWQAGNEVATVDFLRELASIKGEDEEDRIDKITETWTAREKLREKADAILDPPESVAGESDKTPADKSDAPYKVPHQRYYDLCRAIQKSGIAGGKLATECLKYAVGEIETIKGLIESAEAEEKKKTKKKAT